MPLYEFKCDKCTYMFEELCRMGENGRGRPCPKCGAKKLRRLMSVFAVGASSTSSRSVSGSNAGSSCSTCSSHNCSTCG